MESKTTGKRALALLLALQMFCAPIAMARMQDPELVKLETPMGEEALDRGESPAEPAQLPSGGGDGAEEVPGGQTGPTATLSAETYYYARMGFGMAVDQMILSRYNGYMTYESTDYSWGYRGGTLTGKYIAAYNGDYYMIAPNVGRVPDMELDGFYLYGGDGPQGQDWYNDGAASAALSAWEYDESWDNAAKWEPANVSAATVGLNRSNDEDLGNRVTDYTVVKMPGAEFNAAAGRFQTAPGDDSTYNVPVVARWKASSQSRLTTMAMSAANGSGSTTSLSSVYTQDPRGVASPATQPLSTFGSATATEFWLRVPEEQESLTLEFKSYEPYYDYNVKGEGTIPVSASYSFAGKDGQVTETLTVNSGTKTKAAPIVPAPRDLGDGRYTPLNNYREDRNRIIDPARAQWSILDIPLTKVSEAADPSEDPFTTVTITVTAPDGEHQTTYTFHIERLATPTASLGYGNTPYGMIAKDQSARWQNENKVEGETPEETIAKNKRIAKERFAAHQTYQELSIKPTGVLYSGENGDQRTFTTTAWANSGVGNLDYNDVAVVAYQDLAFDDPGVTFVDSEGRVPVFGTEATDGRYTYSVSRSLKLLVADDALTPDLYGATGGTAGVSEMWYVGGTVRLSSVESAQVLQKRDGSDRIDLTGLKVLPGIYQTVYTFRDPVNNDQVTITRPLVVLPIPGDVDMDGAVTHADAKVLSEKAAAWNRESGSVFRLLRERVYNSNQIRLGDYAGATAIRRGFQPVVAENGHTDYFYRPLSTDSAYVRKDWETVKAETVSAGADATLELRYLGTEKGVKDAAGHTNNITGPWAADAEDGVSLRNATHPDANDTFWVGVYLTAGSLNGKPVQDLTLSLTYDSRYVQPAEVVDYDRWRNSAYGDSRAEERWQSLTYFYYNMGDGSKNGGVGQTVLSGMSANEYDMTGTAWARSYATHYSKVEGDLEQTAAASDLRELVVSLQSKSSRRATLRDGCLLVLPFRLIKHPEAAGPDNKVHLVELSAGMRDLNLVSQPTGSALAGANANQIAWMAQLMETTAGVRAAGDQTYAFSAQTDIYGGATQNLRGVVDCAPTESGLVLLGKDNTERVTLYNQALGSGRNENAKYDVEFLRRGLPASTGFDASALPPGLTYSTATGEGRISGRPTAVGEYDFTIDGNLYRIVVEKRVIQYNVVSRTTYYGETIFRGAENQTDYTFTYLADGLADRDIPAGSNRSDFTGSRNGDELKDILAAQHYTVPAFTASDERTGAAVEKETGIGRYFIYAVDPKADNYEFVYVRDNTSYLEIAPRPIQVDAIVADYFAAGDTRAQVYNDDYYNARQFVLDETVDGMELKLTIPERGAGNTYNQYYLSDYARVGDDKLKLTFLGQFQRNDYDNTFSDTTIHLQENKEARPIGNINYLTLDTRWPANQNYRLVSDNTIQRESLNQVQGTVLRRGITGIEITSVPSVLGGYTAVAGDTITDHTQLRIKLHLEDKQAGDFQWDYNSTDLQVWNLHFNWVSPEEKAQGELPENRDNTVGTGWDPTKPAGEQDSNPYGPDIPFTTAMEGWYLCIAAYQYEVSGPGTGSAPKVIKVYSQRAIHIAKRSITLTPQRNARFYGEENPDLTYLYDTSGLSITAQQKVKELMADKTGAPYDTLRGTPEELEVLLKDDPAFTLPTLTVKQGKDPASADVTKETDVGGGQYYVVIAGANSTDYAFRYTREDDTRAHDDFGYASFFIYQRPVVIDHVYSAVSDSGTGSTDHFATIYADTRTLFLEEQVDGSVRTPFTADMSRVVFRQAAVDTSGNRPAIVYYNAKNTAEVRREDVGYNSADAVLDRDKENLQLSYTVRFIPDRTDQDDMSHAVWQSFTENYFDVDLLTDAGGEAQRPVEIGDLKLTGSAANNYLLVYADGQQALREAPAQAEIYTAPDPSHRNERTGYQRYGTGTVLLRPIEAMRLRSLGKMSYTYGEGWAPGQPNGNSNLALEVTYATRYDNDPANNVYTESLRYAPAMSTSGELTDNFIQRGFRIYYVQAGQTIDQAKEQDQTLENTDPLYPGRHNGASIFVVGKRGENDPEIFSEKGDIPLTVKKRAITLRVNDMHRFYGESNDTAYCASGGAFSYSYDASQLASWDRDKALTALEGYRAPTITTAATAASPVNKDKWGEYPVNITTYDFANYEVTGLPGTLYVYPRPVRVTAVHSDPDHPVYTIYSSTEVRVFQTQFGTAPESGGFRRLDLKLPTVEGTTTYSQTLSTGAPVFLSLTGSPLIGSDALTFTAGLEMAGNDWNLPEGVTEATPKAVVVTIQEQNGLLDGEASRNYRLDGNYTTPSHDQAYGAVKLRTITGIHIINPPALDYTYGDTLNLAGLRVQVSYDTGSGEGSIQTQTVAYIGPDQFQGYGLYVNYWDVETSGRPAAVPSDWKSIPSRYRKADTGDHVTIAPTHDTQQYIGSASATDPLRRPFAANGKTIIVSAFQAGSDQSAARPVILGSKAVNQDGQLVYDYNAATNPVATIRVKPRQLQYTLSAQDKTYDGTTQAAGTVTLTNVFDAVAQTRVDNNNTALRETVKDAIYLPIGASYERSSTNYADFTALTGTMQNGNLAFTTGTYTPNGAAPLGTNGFITWANGYTYGGSLLTFTFVNRNVHYEDASFAAGRPGVGTAELAQYWRASQKLEDVTSAVDLYNNVSQLPVEVTNMRILGPDAANYTWDEPTRPRKDATEVKLETRAAAVNYQAAAPFATIHKANRSQLQGRSLLPTLSVDLHTNVVKLNMTQSLAALNDANDEFKGELHYEYALFYDVDGLFTIWAGDDGGHTHQDAPFFGGETVRPYIDPAYQPDLNRLPKPSGSGNTTYKGQDYAWTGEDAGFVRADDAYPGGAAGSAAYWNYRLFNTTRLALPRDTVFYPMVRLSETHNYLPSADLSGDEDITALDLENGKAAMDALKDDPENAALKANAQAISDTIFAAGSQMKTAALAAAQAKVDQDAATTGSTNKDQVGQPLEAAGIKTFLQRYDLLTASVERNTAGEDKDREFVIEMLEAVWFADTRVFEEQRQLDNVLGNSPIRYYGYFWDKDKATALQFKEPDHPIDFTGDLWIDLKTKDGEEQTVNVNPIDQNGNRVGKIYVSTESGNSGGKVRTIQIVPSALYVRLGDRPYQLGVVTNPEKPSNRQYQWTTSNPEVATVDETGRVTIRGVGEATITVLTDNGRTASILVVVSEMLPLPQVEEPLFRFNFSGPWEGLDENGAFRPHEQMTRSQLMVLMDIFLNPNAQWAATTEVAYVDIDGKERYYDALVRLTSAGVIQGLPGQAFAGEQMVTRAEFAALLCRMLQLEVPDTAGQPHVFADAYETDTWAYSYIDALAKTGVVRGVGGGNFAPGRILTREEAAAVIARLLVTQLSSGQEGLKIPTDMTPANWSYDAVLRAVNEIAFPDAALDAPAASQP